MDRVIEERDRLRERLDQFDAHGFPNVAAVLDRIETERAARERAEQERDEAGRALDAAHAEFDDCGDANNDEACGECRACWHVTRASMARRIARAEAHMEARFHAESSLSRAVEALREIADDGCQSAADHDGRDCKTRNQTVPVGYCYPCMAVLALAGQEVGR